MGTKCEARLTAWQKAPSVTERSTALLLLERSLLHFSPSESSLLSVLAPIFQMSVLGLDFRGSQSDSEKEQGTTSRWHQRGMWQLPTRAETGVQPLTLHVWGIAFCMSCLPSVPAGIGARTPNRYQNPQIHKSLVWNVIIFAYKLHSSSCIL